MKRILGLVLFLVFGLVAGLFTYDYIENIGDASLHVSRDYKNQLNNVDFEKVAKDPEKDHVVLKDGSAHYGKIINLSNDALILSPVVIGNLDITYTFKYDDIRDIDLAPRWQEKDLNNPHLKTNYEIEQYRKRINALFLDEKFNQLESEITEIRNSKERMASGEWKLDIFYEALIDKNRDISIKELSIEELKEQISKLNRWSEKIPAAVTPKIGLINAYKNLAWKYRGGSFSSGVTISDRKLFKEYLRDAQNIVEDLSGKAEIDPRYFYVSVTVSGGLGQLEDDIQKIIDNSIKYHPDYYKIYTITAPFLLSRWIGSTGFPEQFADWASKQSKGDELYARVANSIRDYVGSEDYKKSEFDWARIKQGYVSILKRFPSSFYDYHAYLWMACYYEDYETASHLMAQNIKIWNKSTKKIWRTFSNFHNCKKYALSDKSATTVNLHNQITKGNLKTFSLLVNKNVELNDRNDYGETPLFYAIKAKFYDFANALVKAGADPHITADNGQGPIHKAARRGAYETTRLLLEKGVPADIATNKYQWTPLHYAAKYGHVHIIELLLQQKDIDINKTSKWGRTPLHLAVENGRPIMTSYLLGLQKIKVNISDRFRSNPLNVAEEKGYEKIAILLKLKGAVSNSAAVTKESSRKANNLSAKGQAAHNEGKYKEAMFYYRKAINLNPYSPGFYSNMALVNMHGHDYKACIVNVNKAIELDADYSHAIYSGGQCMFMLNKRKEYLDYYRRYIELEPDNFRSRELLKKYPELASTSE